MKKCIPFNFFHNLQFSSSTSKNASIYISLQRNVPISFWSYIPLKNQPKWPCIARPVTTVLFYGLCTIIRCNSKSQLYVCSVCIWPRPSVLPHGGMANSTLFTVWNCHPLALWERLWNRDWTAFNSSPLVWWYCWNGHTLPWNSFPSNQDCECMQRDLFWHFSHGTGKKSTKKHWNGTRERNTKLWWKAIH